MSNYFEETRVWIFGCAATYNGDCGYHIIDEDNPNTIVVTIPAENAINGVIEVKISVLESGLDVMWYYASTALKEDKDMSADEKYRIAADIATSYNNFMDSTDELATHTLCINREDGDIYWHSFYSRRLFYPWSKDGMAVLKDIFYTQPERLERLCYPIFGALIGKIPTETANAMIEKIRKE